MFETPTGNNFSSFLTSCTNNSKCSSASPEHSSTEFSGEEEKYKREQVEEDEEEEELKEEEEEVKKIEKKKGIGKMWILTILKFGPFYNLTVFNSDHFGIWPFWKFYIM